jgi:iron(II)-dependent oxidoreductase
MSDLRARLARELVGSRRRSEALTEMLTDDELLAQHSVLMSPLIWDVAHIANYEELWLAREAGGLPPYRPELDEIYDAFAHPRRDRVSLPILGPAQARQYAQEIRGRALDSLDRADLDPAAPLTGGGFVHSMVFQHEHQHDETILATHQLRAGAAVLPDTATLPAGSGKWDGGDVLVPGGPATIGTSTDPWSWDNERPAHAVDVPPFRIDVFPVTNAQFAEFVVAGGYDDPRWWTQEGWAHRTQARLCGPEFWTPDGAGWFTVRRFARIEALSALEPVQHVGFYEAAAYARWRGRRLPTEIEWEKACGWDPHTQRARRFPWGAVDPTPELANLAFEEIGALRPAEVGAYPGGASAYGVQQLMGDVWEWTSSPFRSYPGFRSYPYDEYSQVFFGPEYRVLRGGSWATHPTAARTTFRNWDYPIRRQIFAGFRTAVSV